MNKDLTVGKPSQVLWQFCLPMFGSIIFQQLYNIADSLVAGKFIGENALAAGGQQLRDHPDLHRLCLWLQHRLLGHRVPLLRRKRNTAR